MASFDQTKLNKVNRKGQRGVYDYATVHNIIDKTPVLHAAFNPPSTGPSEPTFPIILPMLGCTGTYTPNADLNAELPDNEPRQLYLHGSASARLMRLPDGDANVEMQNEGMPITVSATIMDGIILAVTPFNHSCNYRSAVVFGHAKVVTDEDEKRYALHRLTDNLIPNRWSHARLPDKSEYSATGVLRVDITSGSAKVHVGGPSCDRKDLKDESVMGRVWTGVVPTWTQYGPFVEGLDNRIERPAYLDEWVEAKRAEQEGEAMGSLRDEKGELAVKEVKGEKKGWFGGLFG